MRRRQWWRKMRRRGEEEDEMETKERGDTEILEKNAEIKERNFP